MEPASVRALLLGLFGLFSFLYFATRPPKRSHLPPGPTPKFLIGTPIPSQHPWRYFHNLSKQFNSPIVTVWQGNTPMVICNSVKSAEYFLEKNARITSDRPRSIIGDEILSGNKRILLVGYNDRWRKLRKALHYVLQPSASKTYEPIQERAARTVLLDILDTPQEFQSHIRSYAATIVVNMAFGRTDKATYSDPDIKEVIAGGQRLGLALRPGAFKIETFPWLRYWPGYLDLPKSWHQDELALFKSSLLSARSKMKTNSISPCFATFITSKQQELGLSDDECAYLCGSIFGAGSDTSASAIAIIVMAAAVYPKQAEKVREELDKVIGRDRLPSFDDQDDLPYVTPSSSLALSAMGLNSHSRITKAFTRESYRWRPVSSGGFPHRTIEDIEYEGYFIPKGTTLVGNHWGIHRDEEIFNDPERFDYTRWLHNNDNNEDEAIFNTDLKHYQFGFGRRVCPGQHVADRSVFINTVSLLWAFEIIKTKDENGQVIDIDTLAFTSTANSHPLPFKVAFKQRIPDLKKILNESLA